MNLRTPQFSEENELIEFLDEGTKFKLHVDAMNAWKRMKKEALVSGIQIRIISAFRSIAYQEEIIERKRQKGIPETEIFKVNTRPGYSEHHTGRAVDINLLEEEFENSDAFKWLSKNANRFGFSLSYPKDNEFGIIYEPWHWSFRG